MENKLLKFIQENSPDGGFLQSEYWRKFQEGWGRKTQNISVSNDDGELIAYANIITYSLLMVGDYFYLPRGPVIAQSSKLKTQNHSIKLKTFLKDLISLAIKYNVSWIRVEPNSEEELNLIKENLTGGIKIKASPVDVQPREILVTDISGDEGEILARMKQKTRYNIKLAQKKSVKVFTSREEKYIDGFCRLVTITAKRDKIKSHPENYYRKMLEMIPGDVLKLYIAEFEGKIITANFVLFFGHTATYMHGTSDNEHRNVMAPYLLQWQSILDAKKIGCEKYDFGGVKTGNTGGRSWEGITKFKIGFAPNTDPIQFPGSWDIILNSKKYNLYQILQKVKRILQ